jgi:CHAT domain-containing protein
MQSWRPAARELYRLLFPGISFASSPTVIVPDGVLYYLPFDTLIPEGEPLAASHTLTYIPSSSLVVQLARRPARAYSHDLLAYADPVFSAGPQPAISQSARTRAVRNAYRSGGFQFARLPQTAVEVNSIAALFPLDRRRLYLRGQATESSVKREDLSRYRNLHFATHAVIDETAPSRSGIVLSLVGAQPEDGILRAAEIARMKVGAEQVVLSACQTGLGRTIRGEGMLGMTHAFFTAGARRLIVSLWEVNDQAAARLLTDYYRQQETGHSPAAALRRARGAFLQSQSPLLRHPYYWASFVHSGLP